MDIINALFDNIIVVIVVLNLVFRLIEKVSKGDQVPEELIAEGSTDEAYAENLGLKSDPVPMDEEQTLSTLSFLEDRLAECETLIGELSDSLYVYRSVWLVCAPKLIDLHAEFKVELKTLSSDLIRLKQASYKSLDEEKLSLLLTTRTATRDLLETQKTMKQLYHHLPQPSQLQKAYNLFQHDIKPFVSHRRASQKNLDAHVLPLPKSAIAIEDNIKFYLKGKFKWYFTDFECLSEPELWPLTARETPKILSELAPEWDQEWKNWRGGIRRVLLPSTRRRSLQWRVEDSLNMWGDELLSVYLMTLRYGPAAAYALIEEVKSLYDLDDERISLVGAQRGNKNQQSMKPPPAIYMQVSFATLRFNGYLREANIIEQKWFQIVSQELQVAINSGTTIPFPLNLVATEIKNWVKRLRETSWRSWRNERFDAIQGLTITRGQWGGVESHAQQIISGDRSLVLPDQIRWVSLSYAAQLSPQHIPRILKAGNTYHFDDKTWEDLNDKSMQNTESDDLLAALVLSDLFSPRTRGFRRGVAKT